MRYPLGFTVAQARHRARMERSGAKRYPTVLMLEPLYTCNLACLGCSTERYTGKLADRLPVEACLKAADDCGAPIVNHLRRRADALPRAEGVCSRALSTAASTDRSARTPSAGQTSSTA